MNLSSSTYDHTYDRDEITYDPVRQQWNTSFPFIKPTLTGKQLKEYVGPPFAADGHVSQICPMQLNKSG